MSMVMLPSGYIFTVDGAKPCSLRADTALETLDFDILGAGMFRPQFVEVRKSVYVNVVGNNPGLVFHDHARAASSRSRLNCARRVRSS